MVSNAIKKEKTVCFTNRKRYGMGIKTISHLLVLVMLLTSALAFSGCRRPNIKFGQEYGVSNWNRSYSLMVAWDNSEMHIDNVYLDLYLESKKIQYDSLSAWLITVITNKDISIPADEEVIPDGLKNKSAVFVILDSQDFIDAQKDQYNFPILKNSFVLKEIPIEDFYSKYTCATNKFGGRYFNHTDRIKIPEEYFISANPAYDKFIFALCFVEDWETEKDTLTFYDIILYKNSASYYVIDDTVFLY